jgi:hypothetical protein
MKEQRIIIDLKDITLSDGSVDTDFLDRIFDMGIQITLKDTRSTFELTGSDSTKTENWKTV